MRYSTYHITWIILCIGLSFSLNGQFNNNIFKGGNSDGFDDGCVIQSTSSAIFKGSAGDGHDLACVSVPVSNALFSGGVGDGFHFACYASASSSAIFAGGIGDGFSIGCGFFSDDCLVFQTPPVDLTKSFDPVNGVQDRVQVKWYKDSPQVRYSDEDAAMCDIKFWKKRDLIPGTTTPTGPAYVNPDTVIIADAKKTYGDNSPREIFKWPIKFVADGANNSKRAEPNLRYEWQVRCECGHSGDGIESPWSDIKIFNTPDFDPVTGTYTPLPGQEDLSLTKHMDMESMEVRLYPNPNDGNFRISIVSNTEGEEVFLTLRDIQGKLIEQRSIQLGKHISDILWNSSKSLEKGVYLIEINAEQYRATKRVIIDK